MAKKTINIKLYTSELIYDIQNATHLTAESKRDFAPEQIATMKASEDESSINHLLRSIGNAFAEAKNHLSEYIDARHTSSTNRLINREDNLLLTLNNLPSNYNESTTDTITSALHQYIVNTALRDWFIATSPSDAGDYGKLADEALKTLRTAINKRTRPTRPTVA